MRATINEPSRVHTRVVPRVLRTAAALALGACALLGPARPAVATPYVVEGTLSLIGSTPDVLGLHGTTFRQFVEPGAFTGFSTFGSAGTEQTRYAVGTRRITLSGTGAAGTFEFTQDRTVTHVNDADHVANPSVVDRLILGGSAFAGVGGYTIEVPSITLNLPGDYFTAPGADDLPTLAPGDVSSVVLGSFGGLFGIQVWTDTSRVDRYSLSGTSAESDTSTGVPEPASAALLLVALAALRRRSPRLPS